MAEEQDGTPEETPRRPASARRSFTMSTAPVPDAPEPEDDEETDDGPRRPMSPLTALGGVSMGLAAVICLAVGVVAGGGEVDAQTVHEVGSLRDQVREVRGQADDLPSLKNAERGLDQAQQSADDVARLQNNYRILTPAAADDGGKPDSGATDTTSRSLTPYFAPSVDAKTRQPWYMLAADADVSTGAGLAVGFDSGFRWVAQTPTTVESDSTVRVTWLAEQTRTGHDEKPAVLAWRQADYDMNRKTFSDVTGGTTTVGADLQMEVTEK